MTTFDLTVERRSGAESMRLDLARCYNLGFTIRDPEKMQRHLEECYKLGIPELVVDRPPLVMPISPWAVVADATVPVQRPRTSGEVEIVTLATSAGDEPGSVYVTVGSDHTDRALEAIDIPWSKQVAPNVIAPTVWPWDEVADHWDRCSMASWVVDGGERVKYQEASVSEFWTPLEMLAGVRDSVVPVDGAVVLFSGTVVSLEEQLRFGREWTLQLHDPVLDRTIEHTYSVVVLAEEVLNDGSRSGDIASGAAVGD